MPPLARMSSYSFSICSRTQSQPRSRSTNFNRALFLFCRLPYLLNTRITASQRLTRLSTGQKLIQQLRLVRQGAQAAAHRHREIRAYPSRNQRVQADIVDRAGHAIVPAAIESDLEFARQIVGQLLAQKGIGDFCAYGRTSKTSSCESPASGHAVTLRTVLKQASRVVMPTSASLCIRSATRASGTKWYCNILPRGEMPAPAAELVGDFRQPLQLPRRHHAARNLGAHHLHARLPLPVNAVAQAEGAEIVFGDRAGQHLLRLRAEPLDLFTNGLLVLLLEVFADDQSLLNN